MTSAYPFTRATDPVGVGKLTAAEIDLSFDSRAAGTGAAVIAACARLKLSDGRTINHDVAAGQSHLETGGGTSRIFLDKNNPGGVGAENHDPYGTAHSFETLEDGFDAYVAHLVVYNDINPSAEVIALDGRYKNVADKGWIGIVQREDKALYEYEQRYAWSPEVEYNAATLEQRYGAKIALRSNAIWRKARGDAVVATGVPTSADIGYPVTVLWAADKGPARSIGSITGYVIHVTQGWPTNDPFYLASAQPPVASAHAVILPSGHLYFEVDLGVTAWTAGNEAVSIKTINIELSGWINAYYKHPSDSRLDWRGYTAAQYESLARFLIWCKGQGVMVPFTYVGKTGKPGIYYHSDVPNPRSPNDPRGYCGPWGGADCHTDPGPNFDVNRLIATINSFEHPEPPDPCEYHDLTGHYTCHGFRGYWYETGALRDHGWALTEEFSGADNVTMQYYERSRFEFQPQIANNPQGTVTGRAGAELLEALDLIADFNARWTSATALPLPADLDVRARALLSLRPPDSARERQAPPD